MSHRDSRDVKNAGQKESLPDQMPKNSSIPNRLPREGEPVPRRSVPSEKVTPLLKQNTLVDIQEARRTVERAWAESQKRNKIRIANPRRNNYPLRSGTGSTGGMVRRNVSVESNNAGRTASPLLDITAEVAAAAALVAEADMQIRSHNATRRATVAAAGTYWMQGWVK